MARPPGLDESQPGSRPTSPYSQRPQPKHPIETDPASGDVLLSGWLVKGTRRVNLFTRKPVSHKRYFVLLRRRGEIEGKPPSPPQPEEEAERASERQLAQQQQLQAQQALHTAPCELLWFVGLIKGKKPNGVVVLTDDCAVAPLHGRDSENSDTFDMTLKVPERKRTYLLTAEEDDDREAWLGAIRAAIEEQQRAAQRRVQLAQAQARLAEPAEETPRASASASGVPSCRRPALINESLGRTASASSMDPDVDAVVAAAEAVPEAAPMIPDSGPVKDEEGEERIGGEEIESPPSPRFSSAAAAPEAPKDTTVEPEEQQEEVEAAEAEAEEAEFETPRSPFELELQHQQGVLEQQLSRALRLVSELRAELERERAAGRDREAAARALEEALSAERFQGNRLRFEKMAGDSAAARQIEDLQVEARGLRQELQAMAEAKGGLAGRLAEVHGDSDARAAQLTAEAAGLRRALEAQAAEAAEAHAAALQAQEAAHARALAEAVAGVRREAAADLEVAVGRAVATRASEVGAVQAQLAAAQAECERLLAEGEKAREAAAAALDDSMSRTAAAHAAEVAALQKELAAARRQVEAQTTRTGALEASVAAAEREAGAAQARLEELAGKEAGSEEARAAAMAALQGQLEAAQGLRAEMKGALDEARAQLAEVRRDLEAARAAEGRALAEAAARLVAVREEAAAAKAEAAAEAEALRGQLQEAETHVAGLVEAVERAKADAAAVEGAEAAVQQAREEAEAARAEMESWRERAERWAQNAEGLRATADGLQEQLELALAREREVTTAAMAARAEAEAGAGAGAGQQPAVLQARESSGSGAAEGMTALVGRMAALLGQMEARAHAPAPDAGKAAAMTLRQPPEIAQQLAMGVEMAEVLGRKSRECEAELAAARQYKLLFEAKAAFAARHCLRLREMTQAVSALAARFVAHAEALLRAATPPVLAAASSSLSVSSLPSSSSGRTPAEETEMLNALRASKRALERALREQYEAHLALEQELRGREEDGEAVGGGSVGVCSPFSTASSSAAAGASPAASPARTRTTFSALLSSLSPPRRPAPAPSVAPSASSPPRAPPTASHSHFVPLPSPESLRREEARALEQRRRLAEERWRVERLTGQLASQRGAIEAQMEALAAQVAGSRRALEKRKEELLREGAAVGAEEEDEEEFSSLYSRPLSAPTLPAPGGGAARASSLSRIKQKASSKRQQQLQHDEERQRAVVERAIAEVAREKKAAAAVAAWEAGEEEEARHLRELKRRLLAQRRDVEGGGDREWDRPLLSAGAGGLLPNKSNKKAHHDGDRNPPLRRAPSPVLGRHPPHLHRPTSPAAGGSKTLEVGIDKADYMSMLSSLQHLEKRLQAEKKAAAKLRLRRRRCCEVGLGV